MSASQSEQPWHAAFPQPKSKDLDTISREELLRKINDKVGQLAPDFVLVDLRRTDHEGGTIRGSINLPAQTLYESIPSLYCIFKHAKVQQVIWYCASSNGRGPRAAAWFADYLIEQGDSDMRSSVLQGGVKAWVKGGAEFIRSMSGFEAQVWET